MKQITDFGSWDWRIKILGPLFYTSTISAIFIYDFLKAMDLGKLIALMLIIMGYSFMLVARFQLKDRFSILPQAEKGLITKGIYGIFRHPVYVSSSLSATGICMYLSISFASIPLGISFLIFLVTYVYMQFYRAKEEEKKLTERYGNEYLEYKKRTIL